MEDFLINPMAAKTGLDPEICTYLAYGLITVTAFFLIQEIFGKAFGNKRTTTTGGSSSVFSTQKATTIRDRVLVCGPVGSGKTSLFNLLLTGEFRNTVSSTQINTTN